MTDHAKLRALRRIVVTDDPHFPGRRKLKVRGKDLMNLPPELFYITELQVLDLGPEREACLEFQMEEVPHEIGKLINLEALMLDTNELYDIPASITRLTRLEKLSLSNNQLTSLPHGFGGLVHLTSLHLTNNAFAHFPEEICALVNLSFLDLSDNQLDALPADIARLQQLATLMLFDNRLATLPDSITEMRALRCLWLGNNRLTALPRNFGYLSLLDWDNFGRHMFSTVIDGNPLTDPPIDICKKGLRAIAQYFGSNHRDNTARQHDSPPSHARNSERGDRTYVQDSDNQRGSNYLQVPHADSRGGYNSDPQSHGGRGGYYSEPNTHRSQGGYPSETQAHGARGGNSPTRQYGYNDQSGRGGTSPTRQFGYNGQAAQKSPRRQNGRSRAGFNTRSNSRSQYR